MTSPPGTATIQSACSSLQTESGGLVSDAWGLRVERRPIPRRLDIVACASPPNTSIGCAIGIACIAAIGNTLRYGMTIICGLGFVISRALLLVTSLVVKKDVLRVRSEMAERAAGG